MKRTREVAFSSNISKTEKYYSNQFEFLFFFKKNIVNNCFLFFFSSLARIVSVEDVLESSETQNLIFPQESEEDKRLKKFMPLLPKKQVTFSVFLK